ncbi:MAG TPA: WXG100 family type VII secretion target [Pseudonocardia sp.]|jgi:WXG100 family type VII secretion target|uniref:WXG100 family type VII secretion target n=1 Tax=Pseudonocardia sp. TaxID=60912 RepID=UPI002B4B24F8|nr:WXG100 family type VII secretion target [Pseudonocardia sp.]HLU54569.1 WXG100 family type VII secretion target [Pseudonocardia sp.]
MSEIVVTFAALEAAQADVAGAAGRMTTQLDELKRFLAPLVATWQGQAAAEYRARQRQWDTAAEGLTNVLGRIGVALGAANENYQHVERVNAARWRG